MKDKELHSSDPRVTAGHVFTVEKLGEYEYQAVYPESFADLSATYLTRAEAWKEIELDISRLGIKTFELKDIP